jgi:hypothetical protein
LDTIGIAFSRRFQWYQINPCTTNISASNRILTLRSFSAIVLSLVGLMTCLRFWFLTQGWIDVQVYHDILVQDLYHKTGLWFLPRSPPNSPNERAQTAFVFTGIKQFPFYFADIGKSISFIFILSDIHPW